MILIMIIIIIILKNEAFRKSVDRALALCLDEQFSKRGARLRMRSARPKVKKQNKTENDLFSLLLLGVPNRFGGMRDLALFFSP